MKNSKFYNITKGQLIAIWIFGLIGWFVSLVQSDYHDFAIIFVVLIPALLVFYTIGWRHYRKNLGATDSLTASSTSFQKPLKIIGIILIALSVVGYVGAEIYSFYEEERVDREEKEVYVGSLNRLKKNVENAQVCIDEKIKKYENSYTEDCKSRYDLAKAKYDDCREDLYWLKHYECLGHLGANYEVIDCSSDAIKNKIESENAQLCNAEVNSELFSIKYYEESVTRKFLKSQPAIKSSFTQEELQDLYEMFPREVFNDKTKERLNSFIEKEGYEIES